MGSSRGRGVSPIVQPVTETKCGPWLHWHRGQSSRSHTPWHTHTHALRVRSQAVQHGAPRSHPEDAPRQMQDAGPRHDSAYPDPHSPQPSGRTSSQTLPHTTSPWRLCLITIWYNLVSRRTFTLHRSAVAIDPLPAMAPRRRRGLESLTEGGRPAPLPAHNHPKVSRSSLLGFGDFL